MAMKNFSMKKLYYSISEVSRICDLEQYVLDMGNRFEQQTG
jgi:hypothetical protein